MIKYPWEEDEEESEAKKFLSSLSRTDRDVLEGKLIIGCGGSAWPMGSYEDRVCSYEHYRINELKKDYDKVVSADERKKKDKREKDFKEDFKEQKEKEDEMLRNSLAKIHNSYHFSFKKDDDYDDDDEDSFNRPYRF